MRRIMTHRNAITRLDVVKDQLMSPTEYLETAFRQYGFDAVSVMFKDDETISAVTMVPGSIEASCWICEIGSDDDRYIFIHERAYRPGSFAQHVDPLDVLTFPLMPEA